MRITSFHSKFKQRFALWQAVIFCGLISISVGCRDNSLLGLELQPDGQFDTLQFTDTFSIRATTILGKRQRSDEAQSYIGAIQTPEFGYSQSNLIFNLSAQTGLLGSGTASKPAIEFNSMDSVVLQLRPNQIYGRASAEIPVEVVEINEAIDLDDELFSDFDPEITGGVLGSATWSRPRQIDARTDSTFVDGQNLPLVFRIRLNDEFGDRILEGINGPWGNIGALRSDLNGLMVRVADSAMVNDGAIYSFALLTGESKVLVYFTNSDGNPESLELPISSTCARVNQFSHSYDGSLAADYLASSSKNHDLLFVQGLSGLKSEIQIPGLYSFGRSQFSAIAKATLSFKLSDKQPSVLGSSEQLFLLELEKDRDETLTPDFLNSVNRSGGFYSSDDNGFTFDITRHVQRIAQSAQNGENINYGLTLNAQVPVLNGNDTSHNIIQGLDNIVVKVYHTDLNN